MVKDNKTLMFAISNSLSKSEAISFARTQEGNPAYPHIDREPNRYEYETSVEIEGEQEPIHGGKIKKQSTD
jgi:hypothetical protein